MTITTITRRAARLTALALAGLALAPEPALAMHISEGILPAPWALLWYAAAAPFVWMGIRTLNQCSPGAGVFKPFVGLVGAAVFIISCMPIPVPVAGTTAHPCGVGLAAILVGPWITTLISSVALALQALFLAHGGITTLGANITSMGVFGPFAAYAAFRLVMAMGVSGRAAAFTAGVVGDWVTYMGTSLFLALGLSGPGEFWGMFLGIMVAFVPTQLPLGILEGFVSAGAYEFIRQRRPELIPTQAREAAA